MKRPVLAGAALAAVAAGAAAQTADPAAEAFVRQLVQAINRGDAASRRVLMHPAALRCDRVQAESGWAPPRHAIPPDHRWRIEPAPATSQGLFAERFDYPVLPTHYLHIDYTAAPNRTHSLLLQIVREGGRWQEVTGCPKPSTLDEARRAAPQRAQQAERIVHVAAQLQPALKAEVLRLVAEGRKVDAILSVRQATGEDLAVAKGVVERLAAAAPR
jgi:hypothetical protein